MDIHFRNVTYKAPREPHPTLLDRISLSFPAGSVTLVAGCAGSGKTTLLQLIAGVIQPTVGEILVEGSAVTGTGYMHQYPEQQFFLPTVQAELLYSLRPLQLGRQEREERIRQAAAQCGLDGEHLLQSPYSLSGGQRRRAALASVLAVDPDWLVLDEPSAGLDSSMADWLVRHVENWKWVRGNEGGAIIASHDLDLFLPVADQVVLLSGGSLLGQWNRETVMREPQLLREAGLGVPDCVKLAYGSGAADLGIAAVTQALFSRYQSGAAFKEIQPAEEERSNPAGKAGTVAPEPADIHLSGLASLDPRAKWFAYLLFSLAVLAGPSWPVTAAGLILVSGVAFLGSIPAARWLRPLLPFGWFLLFAFAIGAIYMPAAGEGWTGVRFGWQQGLPTLERLSALIPVMAGGILFSNSTPPMAVQKGLAAVLSRIPGFTKAGEWISLAVALLFRFIRWLPAELNRFAMLASLRGRRKAKPSGKLAIRQLPGFFIPLLLSLLQHAEELSMALTAKGLGQQGAKRTTAVPLQWKRRDTAACLAAIMASAGLWVIRWLSGG